MTNRIMNIFVRVQYNGALAMTGAIKETSQQKIYNDLGLESLRFRRWFRGFCVFYKIKITQLPSYLYEHIPKSNHETLITLIHIIAEQTHLNILFFPYTIVEWNKLDANLNFQGFRSIRN